MENKGGPRHLLCNPSMSFLLVPFLFAFLAAFPIMTNAQVACSSHPNCTSCASSASWWGQCRWCPIDGRCHETGAIGTNPCDVVQNIENSKFCSCSPVTCKPRIGYNATVCSWYQDNTSNPDGTDPSTWKGGDFLLDAYGSAAHCACSGGSDVLWNGAAPSCVRTFLLEAHLNLPSDTKREMRKLALINDYLAFTEKYLDMIYDIHVSAYASCCCPGRPAPLPDWVGIFFAGALLPCNAVIIPSILEFGRCGCGW